MVLAHVVASVVLAWWLTKGEAALWRRVRRLTARLRRCSRSRLSRSDTCGWPGAVQRSGQRRPSNFSDPPPGGHRPGRERRHVATAHVEPSRHPRALLDVSRLLRRITMPGSTNRRRAATRATFIVAASIGAVLLSQDLPPRMSPSSRTTPRVAPPSILTFRVPNEEDAAVTTKVDIKFPAKNPIASVKPAPKPGWTVTTKSVTFNPPIKTDDGEIIQGVGEVIYRARATPTGYPRAASRPSRSWSGRCLTPPTSRFPPFRPTATGRPRRGWSPSPMRATHPTSPPPVPTLSAPAAAGSTAASTATSTSAGAGEASTTATNSTSYATTADANTAKLLGIFGIIVGVLGLIARALALARARRAAPAPPRARNSPTPEAARLRPAPGWPRARGRAVRRPRVPQLTAWRHSRSRPRQEGGTTR